MVNRNKKTGRFTYTKESHVELTCEGCGIKFTKGKGEVDFSIKTRGFAPKFHNKYCFWKSLKGRVITWSDKFKGPRENQKGPKHYNWKGGKRETSKDGYIRIWVHPNDKYFCMAQHDGYVLEHRLLMAKKLGRLLTEFEEVHHKNGIKNDNREENLEIINPQSHTLLTKMESEIKNLRKENISLKERLGENYEKK